AGVGILHELADINVLLASLMTAINGIQSTLSKVVNMMEGTSDTASNRFLKFYKVFFPDC
ncbi:hypothetical protein, partial [Pandoraea sputorum]|uniref:hypothetical protein n=1 Tax=Pandoraea sputorum TaxID=93222 RepID=UPI003558503B